MLVSLLALAALAPQDLATDWMDRVSRDRIQSKGPLPTRPVHHTMHLGLYSSYDDNVNLEESGEDGETVLVPFLRVRFEYSERQMDAAADILANYKFYIPDHEFSDDEERVFGRIRFVSPKLTLEAAEIFQHVSDPVDVVFADRVDRFVSDTLGRARFEVSGAIALEADVAFGVVRFQEKTFEEGDNFNGRAGLGTAVRLTGVMEAVAQAGGILIDYRYRTGAPPDVDGLFVRAGIRGDLLPTLSLTALAGAASVESDDFDSGAAGKEEEAGEAVVQLRWEASQKVVVYGDYSRQIGFGAGQDPWQVLNRWIASVEYDVSKQVRLLGRLQLDHADTALGVEREWASAGGSVRWYSHDQVFFDAGMIYRRGEVDDGVRSADYDEWVFHFGIVITS